MAWVRVCTDLVEGVCNVEQYQDAYLIPAGEQELINLLITGGFSPEAFGLAFTGMLVLFAAGAGTGIIIAQIRKLKP